MKAVVYEQYGAPEVVQLRDVEKPTPKDHEVLIAVHATSVMIGDVRMRKFEVPRAQWLFARLYLGVFSPKRKILGMELAGTIEAIGEKVTKFKVGDAVFASTFESDFGGHAEYKCLPEDGLLALKPTNLSFEEAAAGLATGGITAMLCFDKLDIRSGQAVLIYGASGSVGTYAVQLAKHSGATVTGVCSTANIELVKSLGADHVIDYTKDDFSQYRQRYDVIFDAVGKLDGSWKNLLLKPGGKHYNVNKSSGKLKAEHLEYLKDLVEAGKLKPVIDRCYPLEEIVEAHRYVETGHKKGNVVIQVVPATV